MGAPDGAHEIDDRHDHQARCDYLHTQCYRSSALGTDNPGSGRDDDEEECAPGFCEKATPFMGGVPENRASQSCAAYAAAGSIRFGSA